MRGLTALLSLVAASGFQTAIEAQNNIERLPGEIQIDFAGSLVYPTRVPTIREIIGVVSSDKPSTVAVMKVHHNKDNHYAPTWSSDGKSVAFLRSDLTIGTRKTVLQSLGAEATTIYGDRSSFEDLATWSSGYRNLLIFDSTNESAGQNNLHQAAVGYEPQRITDGTGVIDFPSMHAAPSRNYLLFRRDRELQLSIYDAGTTKAASLKSIGEGEEVRPSPNGQFLAVVRRSELGSIYRLEIREFSGTREKLLHKTQNAIIRNPRFSPDNTQIAFHSRTINQKDWGLWVVPINGKSPARELVSDIRVQEDFRHVGPSWSPISSKIWYFASANVQAHYSLRFVDVASGQTIEVDYPSNITSASEAEINPNPQRPLILFAGHTEKPRDIYAILLSRSP